MGCFEEYSVNRLRLVRFRLNTLLLLVLFVCSALSAFYYLFVREMHRPLRSRHCQLLMTLDGQVRVTRMAFSFDGTKLVSEVDHGPRLSPHREVPPICRRIVKLAAGGSSG